jgi:hypothetical protein
MTTQHYLKNPYDLFKNFKFTSDKNIIYRGKLPEKIMEEIKKFVEISRKFKDDDLGYLKFHRQSVLKGNTTYTICLNENLFNDSYIFPFLNYFGEYYFHLRTALSLDKLFRHVTIKKNTNHFDGYDFWINYNYKGDLVSMHGHGGDLSGIIFVKNEKNVPTFFENDETFIGEEGDIVIFPAQLRHEVKELKEEQERITISFNLEVRVIT